MVELETVDELAEELADMLGIYGVGPEFGDHYDNCPCRICFTTQMKDRIKNAVENDELLKHVLTNNR